MDQLPVGPIAGITNSHSHPLRSPHEAPVTLEKGGVEFVLVKKIPPDELALRRTHTNAFERITQIACKILQNCRPHTNWLMQGQIDTYSEEFNWDNIHSHFYDVLSEGSRLFTRSGGRLYFQIGLQLGHGGFKVGI